MRRSHPSLPGCGVRRRWRQDPGAGVERGAALWGAPLRGSGRRAITRCAPARCASSGRRGANGRARCLFARAGAAGAVVNRHAARGRGGRAVDDGKVLGTTAIWEEHAAGAGSIGGGLAAEGVCRKTAGPGCRPMCWCARRSCRDRARTGAAKEAPHPGRPRQRAALWQRVAGPASVAQGGAVPTPGRAVEPPPWRPNQRQRTAGPCAADRRPPGPSTRCARSTTSRRCRCQRPSRGR